MAGLRRGRADDGAAVRTGAALPHRAAALADSASVKSYYESDAERVLRPVRSFLKRHGIQPTLVHKVCSPAREIARLADSGRFEVVASTKTPVLVIR